MLLALRSLWEQLSTPSASGGGAWRAPRVNFAEFIKLTDFLKLPHKKRTPSLAIALYASGQVDLITFAALLAASQE